MASAVQHPGKVQIDLAVFFSYKKIIEPYLLFYFLQLSFNLIMSLLELTLNTQ